MELKITPSGQTIVKPTALGPVANTDTKLLIYGLFQKGRVLAQDGIETRPTERTSTLASTVSGSSRSLPHRAPRGRIYWSKGCSAPFDVSVSTMCSSSTSGT